MSSCRHVVMSPCRHVAMSSCRHVVMSSCRHVVMSSCRHVVVSSCRHVVMSSCRHVVMSSSRRVVVSSCRHVVMSSCRHVVMSSRVAGLKTIIAALLKSMRMLAEVILLTLFCMMIFALFALQVYIGVLRQKCVTDMVSPLTPLDYSIHVKNQCAYEYTAAAARGVAAAAAAADSLVFRCTLICVPFYLSSADTDNVQSLTNN